MSSRGKRTVWRPSERIGWRNTYTCAAIANANVLAARRRPRTRSALTPMIMAVRQAITAPRRSAIPNGTFGIVPSTRWKLPMPNVKSAPRTRVAALNAPSPANAI